MAPFLNKINVIIVLSVASIHNFFVLSFDTRNTHITIVISLDAYRPDYVGTFSAPYLRHFSKSGVIVPYMKNVFPTKTFVNHFSLATGF